jgi:hypothetical protein
LLAEVSVQANTLKLSDLLPADAEVRLKKAAEAVSLGRAPQAGGVRVLTVDDLRAAVAKICLAAIQIDLPKQVVVRRPGWPIEIAAVRQTLARSKFSQQRDLSRADISLPADFSTAIPNPALEVTNVRLVAGNRAVLVSLRCRERAACGSFLAEIAVHDRSADEARTLSSVGGFSPPAPKVVAESGPVLIQPGRAALLVIDGGGFRITEPVMPLKRARLGETVRVADPRTHRQWLAQVSGDGVLRVSSGSNRKEEVQ